MSPAMSAMGQKQTCDGVSTTSALPLKADMVQHDRDVRFVPLSDIRDPWSCGSITSSGPRTCYAPTV